MPLRMAGLLSVIILLTSTQAFSQDVIYTMEGEKQEARVQVVGPETITYQRVADSADVKRKLSLSQVYMIRYENGQEEIIAGDANPSTGTKPDTGSTTATTADGKPLTALSEEKKCALGKSDAKAYHGKKGLHVVYGLLLGPIAPIGAALSSPSPQSGSATVLQSENQALFDDPVYRSCYEKQAKKSNIVATLFGPIAGLFFLLSLGL